jgi:hypothetical protein
MCCLARSDSPARYANAMLSTDSDDHGPVDNERDCRGSGAE